MLRVPMERPRLETSAEPAAAAARSETPRTATAPAPRGAAHNIANIAVGPPVVQRQLLIGGAPQNAEAIAANLPQDASNRRAALSVLLALEAHGHQTYPTWAAAAEGAIGDVARLIMMDGFDVGLLEGEPSAAALRTIADALIRGVVPRPVATAAAPGPRVAAAGATLKLYHGTTKGVADALAGGTKVDARGKGEFGGGFYMTHNAEQAAHIAHYYCVKEARADASWAVVEFDIPLDLIAPLMGTRVDLDPKSVGAYYKGKDDHRKESPHDWTMGPIKDRATPYVQHLFAQRGLLVLNQARVTRRVVDTGLVNDPTLRGRWQAAVAGYDMAEDEILNQLLGDDEDDEVVSEMEDERKDSKRRDDDRDDGKASAATASAAAAAQSDDAAEDDDLDIDIEAIRERVNEAITKKAAKLTRAVRREVEEALEAAQAAGSPLVADLLKEQAHLKDL